jgi:hypothetical protein
MAEYIEREKIGLTDFEIAMCNGDYKEAFKMLLEKIESIPAADVRPVVRGKWERMSDNDVFGDIHCKCSACGEDWWQGPGWFRKANFCPNCGADMREES